MKYLKYFESDEIDHYNGLTTDFVNDMFVDISDMGFDVNTFKYERSVVINPHSVERSGIKTEIGIIPYMEIRIKSTLYDGSRNQLIDNDHKLKNIKDSELFRELIDVANDRLDGYGWYISEELINGTFLKIFLHRKQDKKYVV